MPAQPPHQLASAVLLDAAGRHVLLVRDTAAPRWRLPVGHAEGGEPLAEAARREVREQTGQTRATVHEPHLGLQQDLVECHGRQVRHVEHVFVLTCDPGTAVQPGPVQAGRRGDQDLDVEWFAVRDLPAALAPGVRLHLAAAVRMVQGP